MCHLALWKFSSLILLGWAIDWLTNIQYPDEPFEMAHILPQNAPPFRLGVTGCRLGSQAQSQTQQINFIKEPEHKRIDSSPLYVHFNLVIVLTVLLLWLNIYKLNNQKTVAWHLYSKLHCSRTSSEAEFVSIAKISQSAERQRLEIHKSG